jgi:ribonuclease E
MAIKMLIDATQPEEKRIAIVDGNKLQAFEFESALKKQIKSNIYLAKVTRVEPSLQAAFVEYGGNKQGFLSFAEIHPDYYRIPIEDREALLAAEAELAAAEEGNDADEDTPHHEHGVHPTENASAAQDDADGDEHPADAPRGEIAQVDKDNSTEALGGEDHDEKADRLARKLAQLRRRYKIQEVIERRQIMLIQVTKEERGNKGAALTTYISLPGRYCVLMPNSTRGGGVSRKISNPADRKRLKEILGDLELPAGMSVILRTAGLSRTKVEIKRDLDYLLRLWDEVRTTTLQSVAPCLIYEEGDLIKRAIRDIYDRDTEEVLIAGDDAYREARDMMKLLMPSHVKRIKPYKDERISLFQRYHVESEIASIYTPRVELPSGGYIIINQTEALVAIDVNSGRSTRERNIDETALNTNIEAAEEIARQLRLRDMGGLVVIDFIDMESGKHNAKVERALKQAMSSDRARIEVGRISAFGLLELSRQRLHPSLFETHFQACPHCNGTGSIRTTESAVLVALRGIEEEALRGRYSQITLTVPTAVALYMLNTKKRVLCEIEARHQVEIVINADATMNPNNFDLSGIMGERRPQLAVAPRDEARPVTATGAVNRRVVPITMAAAEGESAADSTDEDDDLVEEEDEAEEARQPSQESQSVTDRQGGPRPPRTNDDGQDFDRRRRRRRRGGRRHRDRFEGGAPRGDRPPAGEGQPQPSQGMTEQGDAPDRGANGNQGEQTSGEGRRPFRDRRNRFGGRDRHRDSTSGQSATASSSGEVGPVAAGSGGGNEAVAAAEGGDRRRKGWWQKLIDV